MHFDKLMLLWMEQEEQTFVVMILENSPLLSECNFLYGNKEDSANDIKRELGEWSLLSANGMEGAL
jgi:hypothetical protein